jgi:hypothetical protein
MGQPFDNVSQVVELSAEYQGEKEEEKEEGELKEEKDEEDNEDSECREKSVRN